jgi:hypothetical protein
MRDQNHDEGPRKDKRHETDSIMKNEERKKRREERYDINAGEERQSGMGKVYLDMTWASLRDHL